MSKEQFRISLIVSVLFIIATPTLLQAGELGNWSFINNLNQARSGNVAVIARDTIIYTLGGTRYPPPYPVERTEILPNGLLSPWKIESTSMIVPRDIPVSAYADGYIFAISGGALVSAGDNTTAERAQVNPDGTLSSWTTISILPRQFYRSTLIQVSTLIYIIGGFRGSPDIYRTTLNPDGTVGTWSLLSSHLVTGRDTHMSILIDTTLYVVGGENSAGFLVGSVESASVLPDGQLSNFSTISSPGAVHAGGDLVYDGQYLYIIGGYVGGPYAYRSERAKVNPDGSLGTWEPAQHFQVNLGAGGFVQTTTAAYSVGGFNGSDLSSVEYAPILGVTGIERREWEIFE